MTDENYIEERVGKRNPFRVPEGYFEQLTAQVMEQIPEEPKQPVRAKSIWLRPVFYAAASVCALLISATVWLALPSEQPSASPMQAQTAVQQEDSDTYLDEAADYMMLDNHEIYTLLASE